jgi:hypothetical protein
MGPAPAPSGPPGCGGRGHTSRPARCGSCPARSGWPARRGATAPARRQARPAPRHSARRWAWGRWSPTSRSGPGGRRPGRARRRGWRGGGCGSTSTGPPLEAFAADQHRRPVARGVGAGELPAAGGEVAEVGPSAAGSLPEATTMTTWGRRGGGCGWWPRRVKVRPPSGTGWKRLSSVVHCWLAYLTLVERSWMPCVRRASATISASCGRAGRRLGAGRTSAPLGQGRQLCWWRRERIHQAGGRPAGRGRPRLPRPVGRARGPDPSCGRRVLAG